MKKIILFLVVYLYILTGNTFAKYYIDYELDCFDFLIEKDLEAPEFQVIYSSKEWTNKDVIVKVKTSEPVQEIEGFEYNNGVYEKIVEQNESREIPVLDLAGNEALLKYSVTNIDKNPPYLVGIENNGVYNEIKNVKYFDNESKIKNIEKVFYGDLLIDSEFENNVVNEYDNNITINVLRAPKDILNYKYFRIENNQENYISSINTKLKFNNLSKNSCKYYVMAEDINGNIYKSNIINNLDNYLAKYHISENENTFSKNGFYDINITDYAGNISKYTIFMDL